MPTYITLYKLTDKGVKNIKDAPKRYQEGVKLWEAKGGKVLGFYATMGKYDYVGIAEAPDDETVAKVALTIGSIGAIRTETLRAYTEDEYRNIIAALA